MWELKEIAERRELNELLAKIVEEAGTQNIGWAINELKKLRKKCFGILFDSQMATLRERGAPKDAIESFCSRKMSVLRRSEQMDIGINSVPFIPVISGQFIGSLNRLMSMVKNGGKKGEACFNFGRLSENVFPYNLYFIFDVEMSETCGNAIFGNDRSFLTTCEAIAFATHTNVLQQHVVTVDDSRITKGSGELFPILRISSDGYPVLGAAYEEDIHGDLSKIKLLTSCKSRSEC